MKRNLTLIGLIPILLFFTSVLFSTNSYGQIPLLGWDTNPIINGANQFGPSPFIPTTVAANVSGGFMFRGAGVSTTGGTGANRAFGGNNFVYATPGAAITANSFFTFTINANSGYQLSLSSINPFDYRRSASGAQNALLQYAINAGTYIDIATIPFPITASTGGSAGPVDLSAIPALQNLPSSSVVYFRLVPYGATGATGTWYIFDVGISTANDFVVNGTITSAAVPTLTSTALTFPNTCLGSNNILPTTITGSNLNGSSVLVGPFSSYGFSTNPLGPFDPSVTLTYTAPTLSSTVYVQYLPTVAGTNNGNIAMAGGGATGTVATTAEAFVIPTVTASSLPSPATVCAGSSVTLTGGGASTYSWTDGVQTPTDGVSFVPSSSSTYTVTGTTSGCSSTATLAVTVNPAPASPVITATPTAICVGGNSDLNAVSTGNTINWYDALTAGTLLTTVASATNYNVTPGITTTYYAEAVAPAGGTQTFNYTGSLQTFIVPPGVTSLTLDVKGAQGGSVNVSCTATGGLGARIQGDIAVTPGETITLMVGQQGLSNGADAGGGGGSFVVRTGNIPLVVAGGGGGATNNIGSCGINLNGVNASITTSGTASANGLIAGGTPTNGGGASNGSGGGGGGFTTNGVAGTGTPTSNGKSFVNGGAGGTGLNSDFGGYGGGGAGWFTGGNGGGGGGYAGGGTSGAQPFSGGGGGGSFNSGTNQSNIAGFQTGNGQVILTWTGSACASNPRTPVTVTVNPIPTVTASSLPSPATVCAGGSVTLTGGGATTYTWSDGVNTQTDGVSFIPATSSTYTVTGTTAGCSSTATLAVIVNSLPIVSATTTASLPVCTGSPITLQGSGASTYTWNAIATLSSDTTLPALAGIYTVVGTDANGCSASSTIAVSVNPAPASPIITATPTAICPGGNSDLNAVSTGNTINWYDALTGGTLLTTVPSATNYNVTPASTTTYYAESVAPAGGTQTFTYTGSLQTFTVPPGVTSLTLDVKGAQGANPADRLPLNALGGLGGSSTGTLAVTPGQILNIYVGGQGSTTGVGGYNGGGNGGSTTAGTSCFGGGAGGGGGASDIRVGGVTLADRVIVGAGGGGAGRDYCNGTCQPCGAGGGGGGAGALIGVNGSPAFDGGFGYPGSGINFGAGATQVGGGAFGPGDGAGPSGIAGALGIGGDGASGFLDVAGGGAGGGYYGGGGGGAASNGSGVGGGGGGGGSSYIGGVTAATTASGIQAGDGLVTITWTGVACVSNPRIPVSVTVNTLPIVTATATPNDTVCAGNPVTLQGGGANTYTWNAISTLTSDTTLTPATAGTYTVVGTDANGCIASNTITITLNSFNAGVPNPELLYYKFDGVGTTVTNEALTPPLGTATANILGGITQGSTGQTGGALLGSNISSTTDYLNTGYAPNLGGTSWTISFWAGGFGSTAALYYVFGDGNTAAFRCFTNGVAGAGNWMLRGAGLTDILLTGGAQATGTLNTFVYDATLNNVKAYLNGVLVNTVAQTAPNLTGVGPLKVMGYSANIGAPLGGKLDEFRLYNRALTPSEILQLLTPGSLFSATVTPTTICAGAIATLTGAGSNSYSWDPGLISGSPVSVNPITTTVYTLTGTDANGCTGTTSVTLNVNALPTITATPTTQTVCQNAQATVTGGGAGLGGMYVWSGGISDATPFTVTSGPTTYMVTGTDANGCSNTATADVLMNAAPLVTASATPTTTCNNSIVTPTGGGAATYLWDGGLIDNTPFVATLGTTVYQVTGTDGAGCTATSTVSVTTTAASGTLAPATSNQVQNQGDDLNASYYDPSCNLIASVDDGSGGNILGLTTATVTVDANAGVFNGQPFVRRWYQITPTSNGSADVKLYITQADFDNYNLAVALPYLPMPTGPLDVAGIANIRITKNADGGLGNSPLVITPTTTWNGMYWELSFNTPSFSQFRVHSANGLNAALPATITNFSGRKLNNSDMLEWTTASEQNNAYFKLQYGTDGVNFTTIAKVNSQAANGNSSSILNYSYENTKPQLGHNYYRLQQVDIDNHSSLNAKIVDIIWGTNGSTVSIYPNPTQDVLNIDLYTTKVQNTTVNVLDMSGRIVKQIQARSEAGINKLSISLGDIASGIYTVQVYENDQLTHVSKVKKND